jgi:hypothetical protein
MAESLHLETLYHLERFGHVSAGAWRLSNVFEREERARPIRACGRTRFVLRERVRSGHALRVGGAP